MSVFLAQNTSSEKWYIVEPFLEHGDFIKFCGTLGAGKHYGLIGCTVDAFAHWTDAVSDGQYVFADLQGFKAGTRLRLFDPQTHSTKR